MPHSPPAQKGAQTETKKKLSCSSSRRGSYSNSGLVVLRAGVRTSHLRALDGFRLIVCLKRRREGKSGAGSPSRFTTMLSRNFDFLETIRTGNTRSGCFITGHSSINRTVLWHYSFKISPDRKSGKAIRSEEHTSELQSQSNLVCR